MCRLFFLCLLLSSAFAASALTLDNFGVIPLQSSVSFSAGEQKEIVFRLKLPGIGSPAFNVTVGAVNVPDGLVVVGDDYILLEGILSPTADSSSSSLFYSDTASTYDFSNVFEVVSWDDSVSLELNPIAEEVTERSLTVSGTTDSAALSVPVHGSSAPRGFCDYSVAPIG